jgi:hypothetical protein
MFRQSIPALGLSIEAATENVPHDGRDYVLDAGTIYRSFKTLGAATAAYKQLRTTRMAAAAADSMPSGAE